MIPTRTLLLPLLFAMPIVAQTPAPQVQPTPRPEPEYVTDKGFKNRLFEVKHKDPNLLASALRPLGSGFRGASISASRELGTVSVRDFPENIAAMEEALKRMDQPQARQSDVELRLHVLLAGKGEQGSTPDELKDVVGTLKSTLAFKSYQTLATFVQRVQHGAMRVAGAGTAPSPESPEKPAIQLDYRIDRVEVETPPTGPAVVRLNGFSFDASYHGRASLHTDLSVRDGEKVVVGTSTLRDRALIVVLSVSTPK